MSGRSRRDDGHRPRGQPTRRQEPSRPPGRRSDSSAPGASQNVPQSSLGSQNMASRIDSATLGFSQANPFNPSLLSQPWDNTTTRNTGHTLYCPPDDQFDVSPSLETPDRAVAQERTVPTRSTRPIRAVPGYAHGPPPPNPGAFHRSLSGSSRYRYDTAGPGSGPSVSQELQPEPFMAISGHPSFRIFDDPSRPTHNTPPAASEAGFLYMLPREGPIPQQVRVMFGELPGVFARSASPERHDAPANYVRTRNSSSNRNPASQAQLQNYGLLSIEELSTYQECDICFEDYSTEENSDHIAIRLDAVGCGHVFGRSCLQTWVNSDNDNSETCPKCRRSLVPCLRNPRGRLSNRPSMDEAQHFLRVMERWRARSRPQEQQTHSVELSVPSNQNNPRMPSRQRVLLIQRATSLTEQPTGTATGRFRPANERHPPAESSILSNQSNSRMPDRQRVLYTQRAMSSAGEPTRTATDSLGSAGEHFITRMFRASAERRGATRTHEHNDRIERVRNQPREINRDRADGSTRAPLQIDQSRLGYTGSVNDLRRPGAMGPDHEPANHEDLGTLHVAMSGAGTGSPQDLGYDESGDGRSPINNDEAGSFGVDTFMDAWPGLG